MMLGRMQHTGHLERIVFNRQGLEIRRESLLTELKQRVRDVQQGPDGYLYVFTDEDNSVLMRIEPARAITEWPGTIVPAIRLTEARIEPLPESSWTADQQTVAAKYASGGSSRTVLDTLIRQPALADRVFPFMHYVANDSTLSPRHRSLLILRTAWLTQSANIWATHASRALDAGLTQDEIRRIAQGPNDGWNEFEAILIGLADELFRNSSITDITWEQLATEYSTQNLVDAVVTVAEITTEAILFNSLGIQPDADATELIPTNDVGYSVVVPDPDPPLTSPRIEPVEGDGIRVGRTLQQHPDLHAQWYANERYILSPERSRLTPYDRELLILRTGWNAQAVYEWAKHVGSVGRARDHGLDPVWVAQGADASGWNTQELSLIAAANEMYRDTMISDDTWATLSASYDTHQMMSIAWTVARYRRVSMVLNALGVQPLPDDERFPVLEGY